MQDPSNVTETCCKLSIPTLTATMTWACTKKAGHQQTEKKKCPRRAKNLSRDMESQYRLHTSKRTTFASVIPLPLLQSGRDKRALASS